MLLIGYLLLALVVAAVLFYLVVALLPAGLSVRAVRDNRPLELPADRRMRVTDLDRVRIPVSLRGYRFAETDELIDRLAAELQVRDEEIGRLKQRLGTGQPAPDAPVAEPAGEPEWAVRELGEDVHPAADEQGHDQADETPDQDEAQ
ncbi:MAG TPA: hypothetical protein VMB79_01235 [Jatrophihabitans sp.]|nr:hypothetical protein [Jatrophihabitans sp.]